jgi:hypothetical protein
MELENIILSNVSQAQKAKKPCVPSHMQIMDLKQTVFKFEHWGFERAKERWKSASLGAKDFKSN